MGKVYSESDITWSSIEKDVPYSKVIWSVSKDGIPRYTFLNENNERIEVVK